MTPVEAAWLAWRADGEMHGHSPAQVIGFWSEMADLEEAERHGSWGGRAWLFSRPPHIYFRED